MKARIISTIITLTIMLSLIAPVSLSKAAMVKISKQKATMEVDSVLTLKVSGAKSVSWKSSNKKVAKVTSKGKVTAKSEGAATIMATVSGKTYTCDVTVIDSNKVGESSYEPIPTPTPTPEHQKSIVEIEITPDNWLIYFEYCQKEYWVTNIFDEITDFYFCGYYRLKEDYGKRTAKESIIKYEFSVEQGNMSAFVDYNSKSFEVYEDAFKYVKTVNRVGKIGIIKDNSDDEYAEDIRLFSAYWYPDIGMMRGWCKNIVMKRIQGTLYLYEEYNGE